MNTLFSKCFVEIEASTFYARGYPKVSIPIAHSFFEIPIASGVTEGLLLWSTDVHTSNLFIYSHSLGQNLLSALPFLVALAKSGYNVLTYNLDGHSKFHMHVFDPATATRSLPLILDKITQAGLPFSCILGGFSWGATLSLLAAARPHLPIAGVVALQPLLDIPKPKIFKMYATDMKKHQVLWEMITEQGCLDWQFLPYLAGYGQHVHMRYRIELGQYVGDFLGAYFHHGKILQKVRCPTFWLHKTNDPLIPLPKAYALMQQIPAPLFMHVTQGRRALAPYFSCVLRQSILNFCAFCTNLAKV